MTNLTKIASIIWVLLGIFVASKNVFAVDQSVVTISNITSASFTVSWFSDQKVDQVLYFGKDQAVGQWAPDDRGNQLLLYTHHVTLRNLEPSTEYFFRIGNEGSIYKQKTAARIFGGVPPLGEKFSGQVFTEDETEPSEGIVYLKIEGAELLSAPIATSEGKWQIRTVNTRSADLSKYFQLSGTNYVDVFVRAGTEGEAIKKLFAYGRDYPIDLYLQEPRIPFFKVKLPGDVQSPPELAANSSPNPSASVNGIQPASSNFFETILARLRDIF